jgi:predicted flap endonuclease-1-like 5' DNA nuclease
MPLDLQSLSTDTLLYMLMHSGVFVAIMGAVFFLIGLIFGYATWGRYKGHARRLAGEIDQQLQEIATLKRKLGDQAVKPGSVSIATETIAMPSPVSSVAPTAAAEASDASHLLPPPSPSLPAEVITDTITTSELPAATTPAKTKPQRTKTTLKARPVVATITPPEAPAAPSALASIIAPHPPAAAEPKVEGTPQETLATSVESLDIIPAFPELPAAVVEIKPELDPKLGLVYKTPPSKPDDLTKMKGIAKVLEQRLHEFGIYTYEQIAAWTEDQIKELSSRLAFKDRIHREKWVEQARRLQEEKQKAA